MEGESKKSDNHAFMMVLSCLIPLALLGVLWLEGVLKSTLFFGILLLCPILHLIMMKHMNHGSQRTGSLIDIDKRREELV